MVCLTKLASSFLYARLETLPKVLHNSSNRLRRDGKSSSEWVDLPEKKSSRIFLPNSKIVPIDTCWFWGYFVNNSEMVWSSDLEFLSRKWHNKTRLLQLVRAFYLYPFPKYRPLKSEKISCRTLYFPSISILLKPCLVQSSNQKLP